MPQGRKTEGGRGTAWFGEAWKIFMLSPGVWIGIFLIFMVMSFALGIIPLGSLVSSVLYPVFAAGLMLGCRDLEEGKPLEVAHLFAGFKKNTGNLALVGLISLAFMVVIFIIAGIFVAFFLAATGVFAVLDQGDPARMAAVLIPVVLLTVLVALALALPVIMATWFAPALVIFHDMQPVDAMKASFSGCLRNIWPFIIYSLVGFLLLIVAVIPLGLGMLVMIPLIWISAYTAYRDIYIRHD
ncbi:hypothetical protein BWI17_07285 [Betaproteobacteria bacterium GR16-43]|nr:hypothetical protein BWI17_07285 [Betaproteobacteria bacterium GR16-43]